MMFFPNNILIDLLAKRGDLYEQLGLIDDCVAAGKGGPALGDPFGNAGSMRDLMEGLEAQIADINRRIARINGPIPDALAFDLS